MILPEVPSFGKQFAQSLGRGLESGIGEGMHLGRQLAVEKYKRGLEAQQNFAQINAIRNADNTNISDQFTPSKTDYSTLAQSGTQQDMQGVQQADQTQTNQKTAFPFFSSITNKNLVQNQNKPLTPKEIKNKALNIAEDLNRQGIPTDYEAIKKLLESENKEILDARKFKGSYADLAKSEIGKAFKVYTDPKTWTTEDYARLPSNEAIEALTNYGSALAYSGYEESEIEEILAKTAATWASAYDNIQKTGARQVGWKGISAFLSGRSKTLPQQIDYLSKQLKPFVEFGLYQEAQKLAKQAGYGAEETAIALEKAGAGGINAQAQQIISSLPDFRPKIGGKTIRQPTHAQSSLQSEQKNEFEDNLFRALDKDQNGSLVLLRAKYMQKGVPWKDFRDAVFKYDDEHQVPLTRERQDELAIINEPPLSVLDELMYQFGLIGK